MFFPPDASNHALLMVNTVPDAVYVAPPGTSKSHTMSGTVLLSPVWEECHFAASAEFGTATSSTYVQEVDTTSRV